MNTGLDVRSDVRPKGKSYAFSGVRDYLRTTWEYAKNDWETLRQDLSVASKTVKRYIPVACAVGLTAWFGAEAVEYIEPEKVTYISQLVELLKDYGVLDIVRFAGTVCIGYGIKDLLDTGKRKREEEAEKNRDQEERFREQHSIRVEDSLTNIRLRQLEEEISIGEHLGNHLNMRQIEEVGIRGDFIHSGKNGKYLPKDETEEVPECSLD